jgi:hypothetical protein
MANLNSITITGTVMSSPKGMRDAVSFEFFHAKADEYDSEVRARVICFGALGSRMAGLKEGSSVYVQGKLQSHVEQLAGKSKSFTEIIAHSVVLATFSPVPGLAPMVSANDDWNIGL